MLSLVIPTFSKNMQIVNMTLACLDSYKDMVDEIVIIEDGKRDLGLLYPEVDRLVLNKNNYGFTHAVNQGLRVAEGDYIAIVSNDTYLVSGNIRDLCLEGTVTSPKVENQQLEHPMAGSFFVIPRPILKQYGELDATMKIYWSDIEYIDRLKHYNVPIKTIDSVVIHHYQGQTVRDTRKFPEDEIAYWQAVRKYGIRQ